MSNKNYAMGHAFTGKQIFQNFPVRKLQMTKQQCVDIYPDGNKKDLVASIFTRAVEVIVNDIINNNVHFKLPQIGPNQAFIYMDKVSGNQFKKAFKRGKWNDVDFITSNFTGYQLALEINSIHKIQKKKTIHLAPKDRDKITEQTNLGKQY